MKEFQARAGKLPARFFFLAPLPARGDAAVGENLAGKSQQLRLRILPGPRRQLSLSANFIKEFLAGQIVLNRNLRKQKTTLDAPRNEQTVATDFDVGGVDQGRRRQQRNLDLDFRELFGPERGEPGVLQRGARGAAHQRLTEWLVCFDYADASLQSMSPA
jgi:hypothetical protein